jgi:hypothetical protein
MDSSRLLLTSMGSFCRSRSRVVASPAPPAAAIADAMRAGLRDGVVVLKGEGVGARARVGASAGMLNFGKVDVMTVRVLLVRDRVAAPAWA